MNWKDRNELQKIIDELPEVMQLRIRNYIEHSQQQLLERLSEKVESKREDNPESLFAVMGYNDALNEVKALIQEEKERL